MFDDKILNEIFENRLEKIEENIQGEYHKRVKDIKKLSIIGELYYKQGFKDGINFMLKNIK